MSADRIMFCPRCHRQTLRVWEELIIDPDEGTVRTIVVALCRHDVTCGYKSDADTTGFLVEAR